MALSVRVKSGDLSERGFQRALKEGYAGWVEGFHPALGSNTGIPDTMFLWNSALVPVELKIGEFVKGDLKVKDIRPAQIRWAKKFRSFGGRSLFVCGVPSGDNWSVYLLDIEVVLNATQMFPPGKFHLVESYAEMLLG
jgi:hypothetical protein